MKPNASKDPALQTVCQNSMPKWRLRDGNPAIARSLDIAMKTQPLVGFLGIVDEERASTHVPVELGQGEGNASFGEIEDGVRPG